MEFYGSGDDEKRACGLKMLDEADCVVISIGSHNQWGFEEAIFSGTECHIHTLDCTMDPSSKPPSKISPRTTFHNYCIGKRDEEIDNRKYLSWTSVLDIIGIADRAPSFLKMDVEGFEWDVLPSIISSPQHTHPLQVAFELHYITSISSVPWYKYQPKTVLDISKFMDYIYHQGHYFVVDRHDNKFCPSCSELLINKICV